MDYKTINYEGKDYYLVPKIENQDEEIVIEPIGKKIKKIFYVRTQGMWGKDYDKRLIDGKYPNAPWMTFQREECEGGKFEWYTFGGFVNANKENSLILESWYQKIQNTRRSR